MPNGGDNAFLASHNVGGNKVIVDEHVASNVVAAILFLAISLGKITHIFCKAVVRYKPIILITRL